MNYKEVFQLAESKGYKPIICFIAKYAGSATLPREMTDAAKELCELALIQKWLRDEHKIDIIVKNQFEYADEGTWYFAIVLKKGERRTLSSYQDTPHEKALLHGIYQALQLIIIPNQSARL